jgi:hypothetical protein
MYIVALLNDKIDRAKIESQYLDEWFSQYIGINKFKSKEFYCAKCKLFFFYFKELLSKFELWNLRTEIIKIHQSEAINRTQKSISYKIMCSKCKKTIEKGSYLCNWCKKNLFLCVFW